MRSWSWRLRARVSDAPQASSLLVEFGECPSPTVYWWCLNMHVRSLNASRRPLHVQPNYFSQSSCISVLAKGGSLTILQMFVANIATRHYRTSQLTPQPQKNLIPQVDQEPGQYRIGHDWYSKLIRLEHEYSFLKLWTESYALHYGDLLASKKQETWIDYSPTESRPWRHGAMQQTTELNIVATDDQKDHKVGKLAKEQSSQLNWAVGSIKSWQTRNMLLLLENGSS